MSLPRAAVGLVLTAMACSRPSSVSKEKAEVATIPTMSAGAGEYEILWCRGGGKAAANTDVTLLTFRARSRGTSIVTQFEFVNATKPAGANGEALEPGTCAYADRIYESSTIRLTYVDESEAHLRWRTTADGAAAPTVAVPADGVRSDGWIMKAHITKAAYIGSYETFKR